MKFVITKFKSGGLHEKHVVATWKLMSNFPVFTMSLYTSVVINYLCICSYLLTYLLNPWRRFLLEALISSQLVKKFHVFFFTPESSLPRLQEPTTCPYPELDQCSPYPLIPFPEDPS